MPLWKTALVIDDEASVAEYVSRILVKMKMQPTMCFRIEDAFPILGIVCPDIVITDIFMNGMGGIEGIRRLKELCPQSPIIAMSGGWGGLDGTTAIRAATKIGADFGLAKPFKRCQLEGVVSRALR